MEKRGGATGGPPSSARTERSKGGTSDGGEERQDPDETRGRTPSGRTR